MNVFKKINEWRERRRLRREAERVLDVYWWRKRCGLLCPRFFYPEEQEAERTLVRLTRL